MHPHLLQTSSYVCLDSHCLDLVTPQWPAIAFLSDDDANTNDLLALFPVQNEKLLTFLCLH